MHNFQTKQRHWIGLVAVIFQSLLRGLLPIDARRRTQAFTSNNWVPTHIHKKGGEYRVLTEGVLEADHSEVVVYEDIQGKVWVRSKKEFFDGRFTPINNLNT